MVEVTEETVETVVMDDVNFDKLAALKAKLQAVQVEAREEVQGKEGDEVPPSIVSKKTRSIRLGVVGSGQGGTRLSESFFKLGYPAIAFNTALQDLNPINIPEANKMLLDYGLGGAAREKDIGLQAALMHKDAIRELISDKLQDSQVNIFCVSLGGGSGAGSLPVMIDLLVDTGKPLVVMAILPMSNEDAQVKKNSLETLSELSKEVQAKRVANLIVVDNAKIEHIYSDVGQFDFYPTSNKAIVEPIDAFNTFSSRDSAVKGLDSSEFGKIFVGGGGLSIYGKLSVQNYQDEFAIAEAVVANLNSGLLAGGFDLKQTKYAGVLLLANEKVWKSIPSSSVGYAMNMIEEMCGTPDGAFRGIYTADIAEDEVQVWFIFSGLGLPTARVEQLKKETAELGMKTKEKEQNRNLTLSLDTGTHEDVSAAAKVREKIAAKKSAFGSLMGGAVVDKRKR